MDDASQWFGQQSDHLHTQQCVQRSHSADNTVCSNSHLHFLNDNGPLLLDSSLKHLSYLHYNEITAIPIGAFSGLTQLTKLFDSISVVFDDIKCLACGVDVMRHDVYNDRCKEHAILWWLRPLGNVYDVIVPFSFIGLYVSWLLSPKYVFAIRRYINVNPITSVASNPLTVQMLSQF